MSGQPGNLDELPGLLGQLREQVREAHGVTKDLRAAIKEAREYADGLLKIVDAAADAARTAAHEAGAAQLTDFEAHIQAEMNRSTADLNRAVEAARVQVVKALTVRTIEADNADPLGPVRVHFEGALFDENALPGGGRPNGKTPPHKALAAADRAAKTMEELMTTIQRMRSRLDAEVRDYREAMR